VFDAAWVRSVRWSPAGTDLLVSGSTPAGAVHTFLVPRSGDDVRALTYLPAAAWSPDGQRLAGGALPSKRLEIVDVATGEVSSIPLGGTFQWLYDVDWSPSGSVLAYLTAGDGERHTISTTTVDGGTQQAVVEQDGRLFSPRFSASGDALYYLKDRDETRELWKAAVDPGTGAPDGKPTLLLAGLEAGDHLAIARDGRTLLYTKGSSHSNLWLVEPDPGGGRARSTRLTTGTQLHAGQSFSPDGEHVAFIRGSKSRANVFVMALDGGTAQQLTFLDAETWRPVWSPRGDEIAFGSTGGGVPRIWRVGARGGAPSPFERTSLGDDLAWAPGSHILYQRPGNSEYRFLDPATEREVPLSVGSSSSSSDPMQFFSFMVSPVYAPDGQRVAINCNCPDGAGVWLAARGKAGGVLLYEGEHALPVGWSADGASVYVLVPDKRLVLAVPARRGEPEVVAELPFRRVDSVVVAPDGARIVCSVPEAESDVWLVDDFDPS
jgi:Tol biopolymer transport system component